MSTNHYPAGLSCRASPVFFPRPASDGISITTAGSCHQPIRVRPYWIHHQPLQINNPFTSCGGDVPQNSTWNPIPHIPSDRAETIATCSMTGLVSSHFLITHIHTHLEVTSIETVPPGKSV